MAAFDLDGTCLDSKGRLSDRTREVLERAGKQGICLVIATGRPLSGIPKELWKVDGMCYMIALNGSRIYDVKAQKTIFVQGLNKACLKKTAQIVQKHSVLADFFAGDQVYCEKKVYQQAEQFLTDTHFCSYYLQTRTPVEDLWQRDLAAYEPVEKINLFFDDLAEKAQVQKELLGLEDTKVCSGMEYNLELNHCEVNKGNAIKRLAGKMQIPREEIFGCGDGGNDIELLQAAGVGVAMGNAKEAVKKVADFVTAGNDEDGAAASLEKYLG